MDPPRPIDHRAPEVAAAIATIQRAAYRIEADLIGYDRIPPLLESEEDVMALGLVILGVHEDGQLVGLAGYDIDDGVVDIDRLAVDPGWFRRGIARTLLREIHAREPAARRFVVTTGAANTPATTLYASLGYQHIGTATIDGCDVARYVRAGRPG
jgi:ribosomal protein S18 acetylase RimI-like enzyme